MEQNIEKIWKNIHDPLKSFILKKVKDPAETDDIIQETFIKMKLNIEKLQDFSKINSWVYQIARNNINDYFRNKNKLSEKLPEDLNSLKLVTEEDDEIKTLIQTKRFSDYTSSVINQLPEKYRDAVYWVDIKGITQNELAEKLGISVSGAKSRVQRGRQKIKEIVLQCCDVNADKYGNIVDYVPRNPERRKRC
ncbi:MAG: RNA polymerase sigma factor SigZ [Chloroflexia bacterium]|nr:RNA polymerase sigma factor SigZ [Chloroflexia bacterium]